ncbi:MAG: hypothetical protein U9O24_05020 [Campylobacterota bacterium]|nr:hypothetical protein [Campylobacterota bacterium]
MPCKPHIEIVGHYYIINKGVTKVPIFREPANYASASLRIMLK